jgi:iron-sulfur cluster repair protein YtfE (RIC family)
MSAIADLARHTSRRLFEEHIAVIALLERFGRTLARLTAPPAADDPAWGRLLPELTAALEHEITGHFELEEKQLFPRLREHGAGDLADLLLEEHGVIREVSRPLLDLLKLARAGSLDGAGWKSLRALGLELVDRLSAHAQMEQGSLVPLVDEMLDETTDMVIWNDYVN